MTVNAKFSANTHFFRNMLAAGKQFPVQNLSSSESKHFCVSSIFGFKRQLVFVVVRPRPLATVQISNVTTEDEGCICIGHHGLQYA